MADNTDDQGIEPEDNEVIRNLRADLKAAKKAAKDAEADARAKVSREASAKALMPEGYEGLADIFEQEVDGDLTAEAAATWLAGRGITATSEDTTESEEADDTALALEDVTDLSGQVAAASSSTPSDGTLKNIETAAEGFTGAGSLPDVTRALEAALTG